MYKLPVLFLEVAIITGYQNGNFYLNSPCGDWTPYKNEKCVKYVSTSGFQTNQDAAVVCETFAEELHGEDIPKLVIINTEDKQRFLEKLLFEEIGTLDTVWLGLELEKDDIFRWNDGTDLFFTNWANKIETETAVDHERNCVQMEAGEGVYPKGKWIRANCKKRNAVVCERTQSWTVSDLQNVLLGLKLQVEKNEEETEMKIREAKKEAEQKISEVKNEAEQKLNEAKVEAEKKLNEMKQETQQKLNEANQKIDEAKQEAELKLNEAKTVSDQKLNQQMNAANQEITTLKQNPVPASFIYVQLPDQSPPTTLWPQVSWQDVTSHYAGLFFRAEGGDAAPFGQEQQDNTRRLIGVLNREGWETHGIDPLPADGGWSIKLFSGQNVNPGVGLSFRFTPGEIRPRNKAVKIWQRIN